MVDEYPKIAQTGLAITEFRFLYGRWIPVQSLSSQFFSSFRFLYGRWIQYTSVFFSEAFLRSDSSMVDEYAGFVFVNPDDYYVQIPLWSMNTLLAIIQGIFFISFRFLYGRWIRWFSRRSTTQRKVQIPLWSMNTGSLPGRGANHDQFRFLYGRWIRRLDFARCRQWVVQIPLWSMNTCSIFTSHPCCFIVQIPLWSMNTLNIKSYIASE